jgi:glycosyltransferase involved in cell wall biosynthesis
MRYELTLRPEFHIVLRYATRAGGAMPDPSPIVSVVIPAYNAQRYLLDALRSVNSQTHSSLEIVVVDDGSTDDTAALLETFAREEPRLVVLRQENAGVAAALNAGIGHARGAYIAHMDADDIMVPDRISRQLACLQAQPQLGFCASGITFIDSEGRGRGGYVPPVRSIEDLDFMIRRRRSFSFTHPTVMYRRAALEAVAPYDSRFEPCEDLDLWLRMIDAGHPGIALPEKLLRYRLHPSSISGQNMLRQIRMRNLLFRNFYARRAGLPEEDEAQMRAPVGVFAGLFQEWRDRADAARASGRYRRASGAPLSGAAFLALGVLMSAERIPIRLLELAMRRVPPTRPDANKAADRGSSSRDSSGDAQLRP